MSEEERFMSWWQTYLPAITETEARTAYDAARDPGTATAYIGEGAGHPYTWHLSKQRTPFIPVVSAS
jgi:hypothetical protein